MKHIDNRHEISKVVKAVLLLWFVVAIYLQHDVGVADNGDYSRYMSWISSGPFGIKTNFPAHGTEDWGSVKNIV
ncbi:MAG: hypothetical protein HQ574_02710 [Chloroflexi bacterium]|nr:hypothetical protein [Chloroflexota bacterium]